MFKLALLSVAVCLNLSAGTIVYSNFGSGQSYNTGAGYGVNGSVPGEAEGFSPSLNGALSQVDLPLVYFSTDAPLFDLSILLETDSGGIPSGTVLESWTLSHNTITGTPTIYSFFSSLNPTLTTGSTYWLAIVADQSEVNSYVWLANDQGLSGRDYNNGSGGWQIGSGPNYVATAFDVEVAGAAVPEPSYAPLTGFLSLLAMGATRLRRKQ